jgi:hypothetical protein
MNNPTFYTIVAVGDAINSDPPPAQIPATASTVLVTTCVLDDNGVMLPAVVGQEIKIRNNGIYNCNIYPCNATSFIDTTGGPSPYVLAPGGQVSIIGVDSSTTSTVVDGRITAYSAPIITYRSYDRSGPNPVLPISTAYVVDPYENGTVYSVSNAGAAYSVTLPAPSIPSLQFEFIVASTLNAAVTISSTAANIKGNILLPLVAATLAVDVSAGVTNVALGVGCKVGDRVKIVSNGTNWFLEAKSIAAAAAITTT